MSAQPNRVVPPLRFSRTRGTHLRVLPIPATDPAPMSSSDLDALLATTASHVRVTYQQSTLAVTFGHHDDDALFLPQLTSATRLPEPSAWARQALRVLLEVMDGLRPGRQMSKWVDHRIAERVSRRGVVARRRGGRFPQPGKVCSAHVSLPRDGVCEVAALVLHRGRYRAVALQMTGIDGRWVVTALEVG
ncbi:MAG: Rv3235 family protein [Ornithinimicrobium sp.]